MNINSRLVDIEMKEKDSSKHRNKINTLDHRKKSRNDPSDVLTFQSSLIKLNSLEQQTLCNKMG